MLKSGVPIAPTLFVERHLLGKIHASTYESQGYRKPGECDNCLLGTNAVHDDSAELLMSVHKGPEPAEALRKWSMSCERLAQRVSKVVLRQRKTNWRDLQPRPLGQSQPAPSSFEEDGKFECEAAAGQSIVARKERLATLQVETTSTDSASAGLRLQAGRYFLKGDSGWCRNGNAEIQVSTADTIDETAALTQKIASVLEKQLVRDLSGGIQIKPAIHALLGRGEEFRGLFVRGTLVAVASTYFRKPGVASYNLTDAASEVMLVDHGVPADDKILSPHCGSVRFGQIRATMEAAYKAIEEMIGQPPLAIRTDIAVDGERGVCVLSEIEGGLDFSIFPQQIRSTDVTDRICSLVAADAHRAAQITLHTRVAKHGETRSSSA